VNTFPLSVRICCGAPWRASAADNASHTAWVRSRGINTADTQNLEWSSTPVNALAVVPSASRNPPTTSICHNCVGAARSHRRHSCLSRRRRPGSITPARTSAR
jgi:hypothetical protein